MNGILNVLKPPGMTSFDVVSYLRGILKIKKIGHTGTLDPGAAGVLPVCIGRATGAIEYLAEKDKTYRAELTLGIKTDTQDSSGKVVEVKRVDVTENDIIQAVQSFRGRISQIPPMYSALKVGGVRLYEIARRGMIVERNPRQVEIYSIDILDVNDGKVLFDVNCSKGTYIRTLCADIGDRLGCGGHMSFLLRTRSGPFEIKGSCLLSDINKLALEGRIEEFILRVDKAFEDIKPVILDGHEARKIINGALIDAEKTNLPEGIKVRLYDGSGRFIALGEVVISNNKRKIRSLKLFTDYTD